LWFFILLLVVIFAFAITVQVAKENRRKQKQLSLMQAGADECFVSTDDWTFLALNSNASKIIIGRAAVERRYRFDQIVSVEMSENGGTLTKTNRGSQVVGSALGAVAFGGVGAIIGGLSGSKRSSPLVNSIVLKLIVDDHQHPNYTVTIFNSRKGEKRDSLLVKKAVDSVDRLHARLTLANQVRSEPPSSSSYRRSSCSEHPVRTTVESQGQRSTKRRGVYGGHASVTGCWN
jgi:hypothetical protein